jgi:hypothetical protein
MLCFLTVNDWCAAIVCLCDEGGRMFYERSPARLGGESSGGAKTPLVLVLCGGSKHAAITH